MDILYKAGAWAWENKERAVLCVMVVVLAAQLYRIVTEEQTQTPIPNPPQATGTLEVPQPNIQPPPAAQPSYDAAALVDQNPFWATARPRGQQQQTEQRRREPQVDVQLDRVTQMADGNYRARLSRGRTSRFVSEGETFEGYQLLGIDGEAGTVELYHDETGRTITLGG